MASAEPSPIEYLQTLLSEEVLYTVQSYFEIKVIHEEGGNLFFFLHNRLHELFHYFERTPCCNVTTPCAAIKIKGNLTREQFFLLFEKEPSVQPTHEKKDKGSILQHCICPLSPKLSTNVTDLDFTLINCLVKTCCKTPAGNPGWLRDIVEVRNELSHYGDPSSISDQKINDLWVKLENAALNIAGTIGVVHKNGLRRRISKIKTNQSQLEELMKSIQIRVEEFEQKILNTLENMGVNIDGVRFRITTAELLRDEPRPRSSSDSATLTLRTDPKKCTVVWKFSDPGDWNVREMQKKLDCISIIGDFNVEFVYKGCLIVHTTTDRRNVVDVEVFREAIEEFLLIFTKRLRLPVTSEVYPVNVTLSIWYHTTTKEHVDTTQAQALVTQPLPRKLQNIKQIDMSGNFIDCTVVDANFVISDFPNDRLVITDSDGSNVRYVRLSGGPWMITTIDNTTVAVRVGRGNIDIVSIYSGDSFRISVGCAVRGIAYHEGHLYLGVSGKGEILVIDLHGNLIKTILTEMGAYCMTIKNERIYYSDMKDTVSCVSTSGEKICTIEDPMIKNITNISTDNTNIYVTCCSSHTVFVFSPDGKQFRQLLSESDGLKLPRGICYNRKSKTLMVCSRVGPAYLFNIVK